MDATNIIEQVKTKLTAAQEHFKEEIKKLSTGRASAGMLDGIMVEAYGQPMPLIQVATISVPEPQLLQITPFDPTNLEAISAGIRAKQELGFNPMDDGRVVRVPIPALTTERRQQIAKQLGSKVEECMISMRNARHDGLHEAETKKKTKKISDDDYSRIQKQIDELMAKQKTEIEAIAKAKEEEVMKI